MSARYSSSPTLHLQIAESRIQRGLLILLFLSYGLALVEMARRGYRWQLLAALPLCPLMCAWWRQPLAGATLSWRAGQWYIRRGESCLELTPERCHCLSRVTFLAWRETSGARHRLWLFDDSAGRDQLRKLRVRLVLQRGV